VTRENLAFLIGGLAFGVLIGAATVRALQNQPELNATGAAVAERQSPAGPMAPTQVGGGDGAAPMMAEIRALQARVRENPRDAEALVRLAHIYHDVSMWEQAIDLYSRALEVRPDDPDLLTDMGICFRGQQQFDRALELFDRAQRAAPQHWQSLFNTAVVAGFDLGQFDRARAAVDAMQKLGGTEGGPDPARLEQLRQALAQAEAGRRGDAS
jgi:tetratricopeptide (TPR) repeat protein